MPSFEASIRTEFGNIILEFNNLSELESLLLQLPEIVERLRSEAKEYVPEEIPPVEPGLEHVYANLPGNLTKLFISVGNEPDTVSFIVYTKHPMRMTIDQITDSSGIARSRVRSYLTKERYRDRYVGDAQIGYSLSFNGVRYVNDTVKEKLLQKPEEEEDTA